MSITKTYDKYAFANAFQRNSLHAGIFSPTALEWLFEWYDNLGEDWEVDQVEVRNDWTEYEDPSEVWEAYGHLIDNPEDPERFAELLERIGDETTYAILGNGCYLIHNC